MPLFNVDLPDKLDFLLTERRRYKVAYGGRGSSKSWSMARALIVLALQCKTRILCTREIQKSIRDSVHKLLSDQIEALGFGAYFEINRTEIRCTLTGSEFLFAGLADTTAESLKSYEGVDICWVEEAQTVSDRSWEILIPTVRGDNSEIWVSFNPDLETDPTFVRFIRNTPPEAKIVHVNWDDNPWFPEVLKREKDYLYRVDPDTAAHVWGGKCRRMSEAQVLRGRYRVESFEPKPHWDGPYDGIDFGYSVDPSVRVRNWISGRTLYVEHEAYGIGIEIDHLPALFDEIPNARKQLARADCARPETISYLVRNGFNVIPATKWAGSVDDGVEYMRSFESIVIHPRCLHTAEEARLWSYKVDRLTRDVLPILVDKHNHCMDAIRYSIEPIIMGHAKSLPEKQEQPEEFYGRPGGGSTSWMG